MKLDWLATFDEALKLKPQFSINYHEDLYWLFLYKIHQYICSYGIEAKPYFGFPTLSSIWEIEHYQQKLPHRINVHGLPYHYIERVYRHGFNGESGVPASFNYSRDGYQYNISEFAKYPQLLIGNFGFVLENKHIATYIEIPKSLNLIGVVKFREGKTRFIYSWIGVFLRIPPPQPLPSRLITVPPWQYFYAYGSQFMRYYANGDYFQDENELRAKHGFPKKGTRGIGELILYRTVCSIFDNEPVKRHYRGRELQGYEIDIWLPERRVGFEFQGEQHFKEVKHWHGTDGFQKQKERDKIKKKLFKKLGYTVIYLRKEDDLSKEGVLRCLRAADTLRPVPEFFQNDF